MDVEDILEHHGIKGQKWGVRNQNRAQKTVDAHKRLIRGEAGRLDRSRVGRDIGLSITKKRALARSTKAINNGVAFQKRLSNGEHKAAKLILKVKGINYSQLDLTSNPGPRKPVTNLSNLSPAERELAKIKSHRKTALKVGVGAAAAGAAFVVGSAGLMLATWKN